MEISRRIRNLIDKLHIYDDAYNKGKPLISDKDYDNLFFELKQLEEENNIIYSDSPLHSIRYEELDKLEKISHKDIPMLSLSKTKDWNELCNWAKKPAIVSLKMDGLSCRLIYENGKLIEAHTRGNGEEGNLITSAAKTFRNIPLNISVRDRIIIDGEAIIDYKTFEGFKNKYANPRNLAAGTLGMLNSAEIAKRKIKFIAWSLINSNFKEYQNDLEYIENLGFEVVPHWLFTKEADIEKYKDTASELFYPIDGLVIRFNNNEYYNSLGRNTHDFNGAKAYKFYDEEYETTLRDIEWSMGRSGILTPVAILEPVETDNNVVTRASLHNYSIMTDVLGTHPFKGQKVKMFLANQIIPQLSWAEDSSDISLAATLTTPETCPCCGRASISQEISESGTINVICQNPQCDGKLANIIDHYAGKKGLDIKGISLSTINKLIDWGWLGSVRELYSLSNFRDEWIEKPGFGEKSVDKILSAIEASKNCSLEKFIAAIGIPEIGTSVSKDLAKKFNTWSLFRMASFGELISIPGVGEVMAQNILNFDYTEMDEISKLMDKIDGIVLAEMFVDEDKKNVKIKVYPLANKTLCITGKLSKKRDDVIADVEAAGGRVTGSVSGKTSFLVTDNPDAATGKAVKARQLNIPMISEDELYKMINGN